ERCWRSDGFILTILHSQADHLRGDRASDVRGVIGAGAAAGKRNSHAARSDGARQFHLAARVNSDIIAAGGKSCGAALQLASAGGEGHGEVGASAAPGVISS